VVRIYGEVGVTAIWIDHAAVDSVTTFSIHLLIRPRPIGAQGSVMGTAIGGMHDTGGSVFAFYQQVLKSAHERNSGCVIRYLQSAVLARSGKTRDRDRIPQSRVHVNTNLTNVERHSTRPPARESASPVPA
jgi:hypothetical protein